MVDYFSRFIWAKPYRDHTRIETIDMYETHLTPIFGYPETVYSDNGSHFVNRDLQRLFKDHGVVYFTGLISHPSSTGLMERAVQGVLSFLRTKCTHRGNIGSWSLDVREAAFFLNTKTIRIHGYTPATIMLGFEPSMLYFDVDMVPIPADPTVLEEELPEHQLQIVMALRDENKLLSSEASAYATYLSSKRRQRRKDLPEPGDLVTVRDQQLDNQKGRKLEPKWSPPKLLTSLTASGLSAWVRNLHGDGKEKRYHINDIRLYSDKREVVSEMADRHIPPRARGTTPTVTGGQGGYHMGPGGPGERALWLGGGDWQAAPPTRQ